MHVSEELAPSDAEYVLAGQDVQLLLCPRPVELDQLPAGHNVGLLEPNVQ